MTIPFFLIDFENVQPKAIDQLKPGTSRIKVFLGQNQSKLLLDLVQALQPFGADAEYIRITGSGPDAVDFHIAFYIGRLASAHPGASFTIISKDRGFDPLVKHLAGLSISCRRLPEIPSAPGPVSSRVAPAKTVVASRPSPLKDAAAKPVPVKKAPATVQKSSAATTTRARAKVVIERLKKATKPASLATLRSSIKSFFQPVLDEKSVDAVIQSLKDSKKVSVAGAKVTYVL